MRQVCPNCSAVVEVPIAATGTDYVCPTCQKPFAVAKMYVPTVAETPLEAPYKLEPLPPPPPPLPIPEMKPPPPPGLAPTETASMASASMGPPAISGHSRSMGLRLNPMVCHWLPIGALSACLVLSFFSWIVITPAGLRAYGQSPWGALFGKFTSDPIAESVFEVEKPLESHVSSHWVVVLPYLMLLIVLVLLGWVDAFSNKPTSPAMPSPLIWIEPIWPYRKAAMMVGTGILFALVLLLSAKGLGLDAASVKVREEALKEKLATADTSAKKHRVELEMAKLNSFLIAEGTTAKAAAVWLHGLAFVAMFGRQWLARRGTIPPPKLTLSW